MQNEQFLPSDNSLIAASDSISLHTDVRIVDKKHKLSGQTYFSSLPIFELYDQLAQTLKELSARRFSSPEIRDGLKEKTFFEYPEAAIREALIIFLARQEYQRRVLTQIMVTTDYVEFKYTASFNSNLYNAFKERELVQGDDEQSSLGYIREILQDNLSYKPDGSLGLETEDDRLAIFRRDSQINPSLNKIVHGTTALSPDLYNRLFNTLIKCPQFDNDIDLRSIFVTTLTPWRNKLPRVNNRDSRVRQTIDFLSTQQNAQGKNALVLLLRLLIECTDTHDALCHELFALADEVEESLSPLPLLSIPETILIPAGEFWMGSEPNDPLAFSNEMPRRRLTLPAYAVGKYPVTNAKYLVFVTATGHRSPEHWPSRSQIPQGKEHHPVVKINLRDAQTYCEWLTKETGKLYRLPTEEEWEKAARGALDTRRYPWGDNWNPDHANTKNTDSGDTTPVNAFEDKNRSPDGVIDMVGNIWEWTSTLYKGERYIIRGGSFRYEARFARNSCRGRCIPEILDPDLGFRIVQTLGG